MNRVKTGKKWSRPISWHLGSGRIWREFAAKNTLVSTVFASHFISSNTRSRYYSHLSRFSLVWLWNPMDYSLSGFSVHAIVQARTLEWVAMPSSRESSWPRDQTACLISPAWQVGSLPLVSLGKSLLYSVNFFCR